MRFDGAERLGHEQRPRHEVALGGHDGDADTVAGERAEREYELERGDPAADDDDFRRWVLGHIATVGRCSTSAIR